MNHPTLETLLLSESELESARLKIQEMAYFDWLEDDCPSGDCLSYWCRAEREWIEFFYVPHREDL